MLFSVVIPVYNAEQYLEECVMSVLHQTCQDFEVILIDDGSEDCSGDICDRIQAKYPDKVFVHHKKNEGQFVARISGVKQSKADYILFVDSDDMLRCDALEILEYTLQKQKSDIIVYNLSRISDLTTKDGNFLLEPNRAISPQIIREKVATSENMNSLCNKCIKRNLFDCNPDMSDYMRARIGEDALQLMQVVEKATSYFYLDEVLYYYRENENSISHKLTENYVDSHFLYHRYKMMYAKKWNVDENKIKQYRTTHCAMLLVNIICSNNRLFHKIRLVKKVVDHPIFREAYYAGDLSVLTWKRKWMMTILNVMRCMKIL